MLWDKDLFKLILLFSHFLHLNNFFSFIFSNQQIALENSVEVKVVMLNLLLIEVPHIFPVVTKLCNDCMKILHLTGHLL